MFFTPLYELPVEAFEVFPIHRQERAAEGDVSGQDILSVLVQREQEFWVSGVSWLPSGQTCCG